MWYFMFFRYNCTCKIINFILLFHTILLQPFSFLRKLARITVQTCWWYQAHKNNKMYPKSNKPTSQEDSEAFFEGLNLGASHRIAAATAG